MLTRCPNCETTFRVTPEQLKARQGRVRCGECQEVFNALDTLVEAAPAAMPAAAMPEEVTPNSREDDNVAPVETAPIAENAEEPTPAAEVAPDLSHGPPMAPPAEAPEAPKAPEDLEVEPEPEAPTSAANGDWAAAASPARRRRWPWALGIVATALVLAMQAIMHFRTEIAVLHPDARPLLLAACETFGCKLLLPRKAELMSIETSDLHPEANGKLTLTATLKNRAPFAQEHPHLELTLTDTADKALVRRVLAPADYLSTAARAEAGFAAGKETPVDLSVEADVPAAGYRLYLFYP